MARINFAHILENTSSVMSGKDTKKFLSILKYLRSSTLLYYEVIWFIDSFNKTAAYAYFILNTVGNSDFS